MKGRGRVGKGRSKRVRQRDIEEGEGKVCEREGEGVRDR